MKIHSIDSNVRRMDVYLFHSTVSGWGLNHVNHL